MVLLALTGNCILIHDITAFSGASERPSRRAALYHGLGGENSARLIMNVAQSCRSFGIVLHVLISGRSPFEDDNDEMIRLKILCNSSSFSDSENYRFHSPAIISLLKSVIAEDAR